MKHRTIIALMLSLAVGSVYGQQTPVNVKMSFSGTGGASVIDLKQPNSNNIEEDVAGNGKLGQFTFRDVRAGAASPQPSSTCKAAFFPSLAGGGVFRFQDGSLLKVNLKPFVSGDCIDFVQLTAKCTLIFEIKGGTGRFQNASGVLTYIEIPTPVLFDFSGNPALGTEAGEITGTIYGVGGEDKP